jgi:hypothetical protein
MSATATLEFHSSVPSRVLPLKAWRALFAGLPTPTREALPGRYRGEFIGPAWLRLGSPPLLALLGMPGWCGKDFAAGDGTEDPGDRAPVPIPKACAVHR